MPIDPNIPLNWPLDPSALPVPPAAATIPTALAELDVLQLAEMAALLRIACGRAQLPLKQPKRALLCILASILDYELYHREHH